MVDISFYYNMRRKDKEITNRNDIDNIILRSTVCRLAMSKNDRPYIVPLCFGYQDNTLYFHSAPEGEKINILRENNTVCFEFDIDQEIIESESACEWQQLYQSVIGFGTASFITDPQLKCKALDIIMRQYSKKSFTYTEPAINNMVIIKVEITHISGKQSRD